MGAPAVVIGLLLVFFGGRRKSTVRDSVVETRSVTERIQERDDRVI
jgi:hypothetical protein